MEEDQLSESSFWETPSSKYVIDYSIRIVTFNDFEESESFDSIYRDSLWKILKTYGVPENLIKVFYGDLSVEWWRKGKGGIEQPMSTRAATSDVLTSLSSLVVSIQKHPKPNIWHPVRKSR